MSEGPLKDLIISGVIDGVGGVVIFLPNILILFFFISFMEDTGYMARAAFIMDKIMHKVGLHGQSFIPLLMGFGCNVPAIMSTRTIKNKNNRLLTILINPFMSCSARLPVYVLIISAFFTQHPGTILFSIYLFGILMAGAVAMLFKRTLFKTDEVPFVMELPPYRMPTLKNTVRHMWTKGSQYLKKMGGVILVASIIIWALGYYPRPDVNKTAPSAQKGETSEQLAAMSQENTRQPADSIPETPQKPSIGPGQNQPYIVRIGEFIQPVMQPLGFDWRMSVSLVSGIAAKEIVVSTMGVLYQGDKSLESKSEKLIHSLRQAEYETGPHKGEKVFDQATALAFLVFVLLYFPCVAALAAIRKETGTWKWPAFAMLYTTALAWIVAFVVHKLTPLFM
jgi:ferrous iron transport protein B